MIYLKFIITLYKIFTQSQHGSLLDLADIDWNISLIYGLEKNNTNLLMQLIHRNNMNNDSGMDLRHTREWI